MKNKTQLCKQRLQQNLVPPKLMGSHKSLFKLAESDEDKSKIRWMQTTRIRGTKHKKICNMKLYGSPARVPFEMMRVLNA
jgi:hypothetical protein